MQNRLLNAPPASLASGRVIAEPYSGVEQNFFTKALLKLGGFYSKESRNLRGAKAWYNCVSEQIEDPRLYKGMQTLGSADKLLGLQIQLAARINSHETPEKV